MSKTFEGAIKMTTTEPGKLPEHYEADLIIRNYDAVRGAVSWLCDAIAKAQKATEELSEMLKQCELALTNEMTLVLDDGRELVCPEHGITVSALEDSLHHD